MFNDSNNNNNSNKLFSVEFHDFHIVKKKKKVADWLRRYDKCNMRLFPENGAISAFLGVIQTIEILQPLTNYFDKDLNTNAMLLLYI